ncbi:PAS domain S-box protein, partial [bacterium]|nr:PAS domain S-box protein [bacterium]
CNDSFCKMLNYRKNEVKDHSIIDFFDKESQNLFKEHFLLCSIGKPRQYEAVLIKKDRQKINVRISPKSLLDDSMTFKGGFAVVTDITEQKRNEKLLNGKIKFEELISSISTKFVNLSLLGVNREITIALKSIAKYLTMDRITLYQKIPGLKHLKQTHVWNAPGAKASFEIIPEIHFPWFLKKYQSGSTHAIINSDDFPESEETDRLNVIKRNFKSAMFFFLAVEGQVFGIISVASVFKPVKIAPEMTDQFQVIGEIFSNIILRIQIETALKESEERLKAIFETNPDPVVVYDVNGFPLYLNHAFTDIFGWEINELSEKCIPFVPEDQKRVTKSKIKKLYDLGTPVQFETSRLSKLGNLIDIHLSAAIIKDIKGISNGIVVNLRDVTEIKKFEVQIRQSQKMEAIGNLASGIAHDFNNILFPIMGNTEMLLEDVPDDSPFRNKLNEIFTSALRGADLVKQILTFSRQEQGVLKLIKMQPVINEAVKMIRSTIPTTINITQNIQRDCGVINADPTQIHQIVMNLATNAYHAMEESGGALEISLRDVEIEKPDALNLEITAGNYARLTVSDSGKGMNKDLTQKIFTPFFTTKEKGKGTGMGLAVVHGIVKNMGGAILVQSDIGKGTKFTLYFPVKKKFGDTE